jgi:hypothetical protein
MNFAVLAIGLVIVLKNLCLGQSTMQQNNIAQNLTERILKLNPEGNIIRFYWFEGIWWVAAQSINCLFSISGAFL